jgi:hypothetical protein
MSPLVIISCSMKIIIISCIFPLPSDIMPPAIHLKVVFCIGVGSFMKFSMYRVTHYVAPEESMIACEIYFL